tara:strand:+ start:1139 stop:1408 length:270 start_codon:yes stop_codon:yes gene_type:complete
MDSVKELNTSSYITNSRYKRHTGQGIRFSQSSRSYHEDKSRKWRKKAKRCFIKDNRTNNKKIIEKQDNNAYDKLLKKTRNSWSLQYPNL